ncbi:hypothetical protein OHJ21_19220 [Virgibacillus sp. LDC1]|nr:hypothetical protein [Virgibacillus sp. LDC1]
MNNYICNRCGESCGKYNHVCEENKKEKFALTFDEPPALVFVQERGSNKVKVFQDGKELHGVRSIDINASVGEVTTHNVEYITGHTDMK